MDGTNTGKTDTFTKMDRLKRLASLFFYTSVTITLVAIKESKQFNQMPIKIIERMVELIYCTR